VIQRQTGINDGKGLVFVSHTGEIYPSGFLYVSAGNVRRDSLIEVYRNSPLFRTPRDTDNLEGKRGDCEFRNLCGGFAVAIVCAHRRLPCQGSKMHLSTKEDRPAKGITSGKSSLGTSLV
jgi:MoaA/NifB/PqqE/SkfB family radical SAM enzyme